MMLGDIELSEHLVLSGLESAPTIAWSSRRTLGGRKVIQSTPLQLVGGRDLELGGGKHFTLSQIEAIRALSGQNSPVTITHDRGTFTVLITGIEPEPAVLYADPQPNSVYSAIVYMQEV